MKKWSGIRRAGLAGSVALAFAMLACMVIEPRSLANGSAPSRALEPAEIVLSVDPAASKVHWTLDTSLHTVHGTFALKRGTLRIDTATGKAGGEIVADALSGESGNSSRDKKMHNEVLESPRYGEIVFRAGHVDGPVPVEGNTSVQLHGVMVLHGTEHEITIPVQAELSAGHWKGTGSFSVPYVSWGLKNPSNFFLKAEPLVKIELEIAGNVEDPKTSQR
jgi:polyisoprenoid-binding protein YceI